MAQLKSLRGAVGSYGRVAAGGIVEVTDDEAKKLLKTKRFVPATDADIAAAQDRKKAELKSATVGATAGFTAMPEKPAATDRLSELVQSGQLDLDKARELVALQINMSDDDIKNFLEAEMGRFAEDLKGQHSELETLKIEHANKVTEDEAKLADRAEELDRREQDLAARAKELDERQREIGDREAALSTADEAEKAKDAAPAKETAAADTKAKSDKASK